MSFLYAFVALFCCWLGLSVAFPDITIPSREAVEGRRRKKHVYIYIYMYMSIYMKWQKKL